MYVSYPLEGNKAASACPAFPPPTIQILSSLTIGGILLSLSLEFAKSEKGPREERKDVVVFVFRVALVAKRNVKQGRSNHIK